MNKKQSGFTLIELLVVIAIIGILAALVLVALGNARSKANDARIKSNIGQLRTLAEVFYDGHCASYDGSCNSVAKGFDTCYAGPTSATCAGGVESSIPALKTDLANAGSTTVAVISGAGGFCMSATLVSSTGTHVCVDNTGTFSEETGPCTTTSCPP